VRVPRQFDGDRHEVLRTTAFSSIHLGTTDVDSVPLYHFDQDTAPGDLNGQGVGGVWWLVAPDGTLIEDGAGATATSAPAGSMPTDTLATETAVATTGG
jgi:hypothetical protein